MIPSMSMTVDEITKILQKNGIVGYGSKEHRLYQFQCNKKKRPPIHLLHLVCTEYKLPRRKTHAELFKLLSDRGILWKYNAINNSITYIDSSNKNGSTKINHKSLPVRTTSNTRDSFASHSPLPNTINGFQSDKNITTTCDISETESIDSIHLHELNDARYSNGLCEEHKFSTDHMNKSHLKRSLVTSNSICNKKLKLNNAPLHGKENVARSNVFQEENISSSSYLPRTTKASTELDQKSVRITSTTASNASMSGDRPSNVFQNRNLPCPTFVSKTQLSASRVPSGNKIVQVIRNDMNITTACDISEMESMEMESTSANNIHSPTVIEGICSIEYRCEFEKCNRRLATKQCLIQHYEAFHAEKTLPCQFEGCDASFSSSRLLQVHVDGVHTQKYRCEFEGCNRILSTKHSLSRHYKECHAEKTLPCQFEGCDASFSSSHLLQVHVDGVHTQKYRCEFEGCNRIFKSAQSVKKHQWFHKRDPEYFTKRPNPFDHDILLPLLLKEKKALKEAAKKLNNTLPMPEFQYYVHQNLIFHRLFDRVKHLASHTLIWVPCKEEHKVYGKFEGHYVTTGAEDKFQWLKHQLWILENPTEIGCTHIKRDIYRKIQFDYEKAVIVAAFAYPWLAQDAKFTANFDTPSSNCYKKDPALTLQWNPLSKSIFLDGLPRRFSRV